jgi:hypothetical protein
MAPTKNPDAGSPKPDRKFSGIGATEDQMDMRDTIPQRSDALGTKIEDLAGTGTHDSSGG